MYTLYVYEEGGCTLILIQQRVTRWLSYGGIIIIYRSHVKQLSHQFYSGMFIKFIVNFV